MRLRIGMIFGALSFVAVIWGIVALIQWWPPTHWVPDVRTPVQTVARGENCLISVIDIRAARLPDSEALAVLEFTIEIRRTDHRWEHDPLTNARVNVRGQWYEPSSIESIQWAYYDERAVDPQMAVTKTLKFEGVPEIWLAADLELTVLPEPVEMMFHSSEFYLPQASVDSLGTYTAEGTRVVFSGATQREDIDLGQLGGGTMVRAVIKERSQLSRRVDVAPKDYPAWGQAAIELADGAFVRGVPVMRAKYRGYVGYEFDFLLSPTDSEKGPMRLRFAATETVYRASWTVRFPGLTTLEGS